MCGKRQSLDPRWLTRAPPLPCAALASSPLRQGVLHMQFTHPETRMRILEAMGWWYVKPKEAPPTGGTTCTALAAGTGPTTSMAGVVVSSAMANFSLLCVLPGARDGQVARLVATEGCPCCWEVEALRRATSRRVGVVEDVAAPTADATALKAYGKAIKYTGCRIWRRYV